MTRDELVAALDAFDDAEPDRAHPAIDGLIRDFLRDEGYADVADAWARAEDRVGFWYS